MKQIRQEPDTQTDFKEFLLNLKRAAIRKWKKQQFFLNFNVKRIESKEFIVTGLQNKDKTVKLACKFCKNGSAEEISEQIKIVLDEWNKIRMIICDTTAVNSGPKSK